MRFLLVLIVVAFAVAGIVFGALNADFVNYDLLFTHLAVPKGAALLAVLVAGWILGGLLVWLFSVQPLRLRLRRARKQLATRQASAEGGSKPESA